MQFRPELAEAILRGEKTTTRRRMSDNPRSPWHEAMVEADALKEGFRPEGPASALAALRDREASKGRLLGKSASADRGALT